MKTVREVLLAQHAGVEGRLDAIRAAVVQGDAMGMGSLWWRIWCELVLPCRQAWACLGLMWVVVMGLHLGAGVGVVREVRHGGVREMGEVEQAILVEQEGMRLELLGIQAKGSERRAGIGPRSEAENSSGVRLVMIRMRERGEV